jgi:hypothetical protein
MLWGGTLTPPAQPGIRLETAGTEGWRFDFKSNFKELLMSAITKLAGLVAGVSTVAVLGVAIAQGQPPNPLISNHAIAAGQQSSHITPMGETGVLTQLGEVRTAAIVRQEEVAIAPAPEPAPVVAEATVTPAPAETTAMGAPPAPVEQPAAPLPMKRDRG